MAKKKDTEYEQIIDNTKIVKLPVESEMKKSFIAYAMAVNVSRAIPDVRDGLKPVHRRILYAMHELGLSHDKPFRKCARIVGDVLGKYHPHGDSAVYDALVRLAQDFSIRAPLVEGHGNFGSVDGDPPAAQRYTEARLAKIAAEMLRDIDKNTVDYYPNFDDTLMQPTVLPARFPNLLVNGSDGIAVGMATSIPPHNLSEVIDATVALLDNPDAGADELMRFIPAPDFPTAGIILGRNAIKQAYKSGRGGCILRARTEIEELPNGRSRIIVSELPYQVNKANLIKNMADQVKEKKIDGISDIKEESDRKGMRIVIDIKRDASAQVVLNTLYKQTNMQISYSIILLALKDGTPKIMNLKEILESYIVHQKEIIIRRTRYELEKAEEREHILTGLRIALANIDEVVKIIKESKDRAASAERLIERFLLTEKQANAILEMRLYRLTSLEVEKLQAELDEIRAAIEEYKSILASPEKVIAIIKGELLEIKERYGEERRSELSYDYEEISIGDLIDKEDVVISLTHFGYIKRISLSEYKAQKRGGTGITAHKPKEEDFVENMFITNTHDDLLFFTNRGKVYSIKGYEVPEAERTARGRAIVNILQLESGEKVTAFMPLKESDGGFLMLATKRGYIKKTPLSEFARIRKVGKIAVSLNEGDELISAQMTSGGDEIIIASESGQCIRFSENDVRSMGRDAQGVRSIRLAPDDNAVDMTAVKDGYEILTITANGFGKRSDPDDYRLQGRAGKGIKAGVFNEKTGKLVNLKLVSPDDDLMLIADTGIIIRVKAREISKIGRNTRGVKVMRIKDEGKVVSVAVAAPEVDERENPTEEKNGNLNENGAENSTENNAGNNGENITENGVIEPRVTDESGEENEGDSYTGNGDESDDI
ncbi:MAG: DNA gyrase subunit A [Clostridiales bacterium]|jgi:DNA gyrase subunit A|nr:DNA gyrase subunit A [Clostridiales bacterium]